MENIGRSLPENVGPWKSLLESHTVSAKTATPNAEHRPVPAEANKATLNEH